MTTEINTILQKVKEQERVLNRILELLEKQKEEVLTSEKVCDMLDIGRTQLGHLDAVGITEPLCLEEKSKKKYYLRSKILEVLVKKQHRKRWKD